MFVKILEGDPDNLPQESPTKLMHLQKKYMLAEIWVHIKIDGRTTSQNHSYVATKD